ncbi:hypothetical protein IEO21_09778 [Rhodonia placenta]|uniref:Secreted protein n=1 Tax=Rhodonia placenta TaxID=104341 RepID=A0A8H7NTV3_9APHY|nr:hypothetical protein IEO21_09778 [Postia placenta]
MWSLLLLRQLNLVLLLLFLDQQQGLHKCFAKAHRILGKKPLSRKEEVIYNWAVGATEKQMASMCRNDGAMMWKVVYGSDNDRACIGSHMVFMGLDMITYSDTVLKGQRQ